MKKILLLSAYRSDSHASWVRWLTSHIEADWRVLELPGRYFRWRIRGNPLSWLTDIPQLLSDWQPDHILATSMVDIATVKGLNPGLAAVPVTVYFHENQFSYPVGEGQHSSVDPQMVQIYAALAAQHCLFNSAWNRDSFLSGVDELLSRLPDHRPLSLRAELEPRCRLLPVPVTAVAAGDKEAGLIVWNHRWEYDKRPDVFLQVLNLLAERGVDFRLALLGARPARVPAPLRDIRAQYADIIIADGMVSRAEYEALLGRAQVVISCADHEFQGLSVIEAVSAGCIPVVPDGLCYREQYAPAYRYPSGDVEAAADLIERALSGGISRADNHSWLAGTTGPMWHDWLRDVV